MRGTAPSPVWSRRAATVLARTIDLARVPAPSGSEAARGELVLAWFKEAGLGEAWTDDVGNCWAVARPGQGPAFVLAAHLDTVFPADVQHGAVRNGDRLVGPSVGDDSVAVASLPSLGAALAASPGTMPVLVVATVGEEGLGNLVGARHAVAHPPMPLGALIALEGNYLGRLATTGVGSSRFRVTVTTPGGHAWEAPTAPSAVHEAATLVSALARLATRPGLTSLNVGRFAGGEAINARARVATFDLELRGADPTAFSALEDGALNVLAGGRSGTVKVDADDIGRRPAGCLGAQHPLVSAARAAHEAAGWAWRETAASTDANAAYAAGIPALAMGVTTGAGEHTPGEWIDIPPIADGLAIIAATVTGYERSRPGAGRTGEATDDGI